jgi:hypothetical protein
MPQKPTALLKLLDREREMVDTHGDHETGTDLALAIVKIQRNNRRFSTSESRAVSMAFDDLGQVLLADEPEEYAVARAQAKRRGLLL